MFCKIVRGETPVTIVYEDDALLAFLDIAALNPGHTLLIPKAHYRAITAVPSELLAQLMVRAPVLATAIMRATNTDGFQLLINNGACAGQLAPHAYMQIIPRGVDDGLKMPARAIPYKNDVAAQRLAKLIRLRLDMISDKKDIGVPCG